MRKWCNLPPQLQMLSITRHQHLLHLFRTRHALLGALHMITIEIVNRIMATNKIMMLFSVDLIHTVHLMVPHSNIIGIHGLLLGTIDLPNHDITIISRHIIHQPINLNLTVHLLSNNNGIFPTHTMARLVHHNLFAGVVNNDMFTDNIQNPGILTTIPRILSCRILS